jgi:hypothetical protein
MRIAAGFSIAADGCLSIGAEGDLNRDDFLHSFVTARLCMIGDSQHLCGALRRG